MEEYRILQAQRRIGTRFRDPAFLETALTHRSALNESMAPAHNERLEFLGDAVLELAVTHYLYNIDPPLMEGEMTNLRAALVNAGILAKIGEEIDIGAHLLMSRGQRQDFEKKGRSRTIILANAMEAIIGAIFLDRGLGAAELFVLEFILSRFEEIKKRGLEIAPKTRLQELTQEKLHLTPNYKKLEESGPEHYKVFVVGLFFGERLIAKGRGESLKDAESQAAIAGLKKEFGVRTAEE